MHPYTLPALLCVIAMAGVFRIDAQGRSGQNALAPSKSKAVPNDVPSDEGILSRLWGHTSRAYHWLKGSVQGTDTDDDHKPTVHCKVNETSVNSCQNLAGKTVNNLNEQIRMTLIAAYDYDAMSLFFARDDVAYRGFAKYFADMASEKREHAEELKEYIIQRGARWVLKTIPSRYPDWQNPLYALTESLRLERRINKRLLQIHGEAVDKNDPHLENFLETELLTEQVSAIRQLSDWTSVMKRLEEDALGWTIFDEELTQGKRE